MNLTLNNQDNAKQQIAPRLLQMKAELDKRKEIWDRLSIKSKKRWVASGKDPIMNIAWDVFKYLKNNFFGEEI